MSEENSAFMLTKVQPMAFNLDSLDGLPSDKELKAMSKPQLMEAALLFGTRTEFILKDEDAASATIYLGAASKATILEGILTLRQAMEQGDPSILQIWAREKWPDVTKEDFERSFTISSEPPAAAEEDVPMVETKLDQIVSTIGDNLEHLRDVDPKVYDDIMASVGEASKKLMRGEATPADMRNYATMLVEVATMAAAAIEDEYGFSKESFKKNFAAIWVAIKNAVSAAINDEWKSSEVRSDLITTMEQVMAATTAVQEGVQDTGAAVTQAANAIAGKSAKLGDKTYVSGQTTCDDDVIESIKHSQSWVQFDKGAVLPALLGVAAGAAGTFFLMSGQVNSANARISELEGQLGAEGMDNVISMTG